MDIICNICMGWPIAPPGPPAIPAWVEQQQGGQEEGKQGVTRKRVNKRVKRG